MHRTSPSAHTSPRLRSTALRRAGVVLVLALTLGGCSRDGRQPLGPVAKDEGVPAQAIGPAFHAIHFTRFVVDVLALRWDEDGGLDASWRYDDHAQAWFKIDNGTSTVFVGGPVSTEIRNENLVAIAVWFTTGGVPQRELLAADVARVQVTVRQRRYATNAAYDLPDAYDVTTQLLYDLPLVEGKPGVLDASGSVIGWSEQAIDGVAHLFAYQGSASWHFDYPGHFDPCVAERVTADLRVTENGNEVDRYSGTYGAAQDAPAIRGALESARGPWRYAVDGQRSCGSGS